MTASDPPENQPTARGNSEQRIPENETSDALHGKVDGDQVKAEAAAVAAHLQRSGVQWLPQPEPASTEQLAPLFFSPEAPSESTTTDSDSPAAEPVGNTAQAGGPKTPAVDPTQARADQNQSARKRPATRLDSVAAIDAATGAYSGDSLSTDQRTEQLQQLEQKVAACTQCAALASCRSKTVFGEGNHNPRVVFFGEGPGAEEDRTGRPFVGKAGELLTRMMQACTFEREDVYILNTVKCRPPANRNPELEEIENCRGFYAQQLNLLRPEYIVCLGAVSAQELLKTKLSVGRLRGQLHRYFASKVLVTYHPAYLLRNPAAKKAAWADLQLLMRDAGITPPQR